jgi:hypothetical protein
VARLLAAAVALALLAAVAGGGTAAAATKGHRPRPAGVPAGFFGVAPQAPFAEADWARAGELGLSDRIQVPWSEIEPAPGQFEWAGLDATVAAAAAHGVRLMPVVSASPPWVAPEQYDPPLGDGQRQAWQEFLRELVRRYGPAGGFWLGQPSRLPIRRWQIWNEPNYPVFWKPRPSPIDYVHLLRLSSTAIHGVDPKAMVVAAGLAPIEHQPPPWKFLQSMYAVRGARRAFDAAALHPYTNTTAGLAYSVGSTRRVMAQAGDGAKPLFVTELGVSSAGGTPFDLGPEGQASFLESSLDKLAKQRRRWHIGGVFWFTWADSTAENPSCPFCDYAGLLGLDGEPKPAFAALQRVVARWRH